SLAGVEKQVLRCAQEDEYSLADAFAFDFDVVVVAEAEAQVRTGEFLGQGWERIGTGDAAVSGTIQGGVIRTANDLQASHAAIGQDGELQHDLAALHAGGFRDELIPVFLHLVNY